MWRSRHKRKHSNLSLYGTIRFDTPDGDATESMQIGTKGVGYALLPCSCADAATKIVISA